MTPSTSSASSAATRDIYAPKLSPKEVAQILNISESTARGWLRTGFLKGGKCGRKWFVYRADLEAFMQAGEAR